MRAGAFHLTYCTNIHAGESWAEVRGTLDTILPRVRAHMSVDGPFGIGLRLSAAASDALAQPDALAEFRRFMAVHNYYVFTINGFPYGAFHGERVKEHVYLPDWRDPRRVAYSNQLAEILAALLPDDMPSGSVSTVPGMFKGHIKGAHDVEAVAAGLREHAAALRALHARTGRRIQLALEPEPSCLIETIEESVEFFDRHLAASWMRDYIGLCVDTCHMAVEYEDPTTVATRLRSAGIAMVKVQVSSALDVHGPEAIAALGAFADDTYLHQVVQQDGTTLTRFTDLPEALGNSDVVDHAACRVHFHVPLFMERLGALRTTQPFVQAFLRELRTSGGCDQLEVETYTWDVLPEEHRRVDVATAIARELAWVRDQLV